MKTFKLPAALPVLAAALALGACSDANAPETAPEGEDTVVVQDTVPAPTETTVVVDENGAATDGDSVSIGEDGIEANVGDEDTRVRADVDGDPTLTVETD